MLHFQDITRGFDTTQDAKKLSSVHSTFIGLVLVLELDHKFVLNTSSMTLHVQKIKHNVTYKPRAAEELPGMMAAVPTSIY